MNRLNPRCAVYTGTFDPVHLGHMDMVRRGSALYDRLVVGVGVNPDKRTMFSTEERVQLMRSVTGEYGNVVVEPFGGLAVRFVRDCEAGVMLRGLRTLSDMEYEFNMSLTNRNLDGDIETVFLMAQVEHSHFSSSLIRQIAALGGTLEPFLPAVIVDEVRRRARAGR